jgi:hypothetical protein
MESNFKTGEPTPKTPRVNDSGADQIWKTTGVDDKTYCFSRDDQGKTKHIKRCDFENMEAQIGSKGVSTCHGTGKGGNIKMELLSSLPPCLPPSPQSPTPPPFPISTPIKEPDAIISPSMTKKKAKSIILKSMLSQLRNNNQFQKHYVTDGELLGHGHFGGVFRGIRVADNRPVAIKVAANLSSTIALHNEHLLIRQLASSKPKHVVRVLDYMILSEEHSAMVLDLVVGVDLRKLARLHLPDKVMPAKLLCNVAKQTLSALREVHQKGLLHRDVKPQNFVYRQEDGRVFIMDFGLSKFHSEVDDCLEGGRRCSNTGTIRYSSHRMQQREFRSYRDDLEALAFSIMTLSGVLLPWNTIPLEKRVEIGDAKAFFVNNLPDKPAWIKPYMLIVNKLNFGERPSYKELSRVFVQRNCAH